MSDPDRPGGASESAPPASGGPLTYASAGVDIEAGNEAVRRIARAVASTRRAEQLDELGGFAGLIRLPSGLAEPVLVACTDGVGTKLLVAIEAGRHATVGIDLVAMNVNDLLVTGAEPLFLLDYVATARVDPAHVADIVAGVAEGCRQAGCALLGGETAEMPGMYAPGHYDLAATAVGVVERARILGRERVRAGDVVLALRSSGLHSNGYSLARRALLDPRHGALALADRLPGADETVADALLRPTIIYEPAFRVVRGMDDLPVHGAAHVTGGGLVENPARVVAEDLRVEIDLAAVPLPPVLAAIAAQGVPRDEMLRTFNCGVGMLLYVDPDRCDAVGAALAAAGDAPLPVGRVVPRDGGPRVVVKGGPGDP